MGKMSDFFVREKKPSATAGADKAPASAVKESEELDIIDTMLSGKELVKELDTDYGRFEFKYPDGADTLRIAHRRAEYLGGHPDHSFDRVRLYWFEIWATLDVLVVKKPEKFSKILSWADFPDTSLVEDLFSRGTQFRNDIAEQIREARKGRSLG